MLLSSLQLDALEAQLGNDLLDALLLDRAQAAGRDAQADEATLALQPEALHVQVRQEPPATPVVRVGDRVAGHRPLAGDLTDSGHGCNPQGGAPDGGPENESRFIPANG